MEKDDVEAVVQKFKDRLVDKKVTPEIQEVIEAEIEKLSSLDKNASEFNVTKYGC